jgi:uncharacterized protein YkwD
MKKLCKITAAILIIAMLTTAAGARPAPRFTADDALNILKYIVGLAPLTEVQRLRYDVDGVPGITVDDALEILKYVVGLPNRIDRTTVVLPSAGDATAFTDEVIRLINAERTKAGLPTLRTDNSALNGAALRRSEEMLTNLSHNRPDGSNWSTVFAEFGIVDWRNRGENIAWGRNSRPELVVDGWMNSEGHRRNILNANFDRMGVGVTIRGNEVFVAQLFLR